MSDACKVRSLLRATGYTRGNDPTLPILHITECRAMRPATPAAGAADRLSSRVGLKAVRNGIRSARWAHLGNGYPVPTLALHTRANGLAKKIKHSHPRSPCSLRIVAEPPEFGALRQAPHIEAMSCVGIEDGVEAIGRRPLQRSIA